MKDKKCTEFVFMPLRDAASTPSPSPARGSGVRGKSPAVAEPSPVVTEIRSKIVVVGSCACGKTALIHRYVESSFVELYTPTGFHTYNSQYRVSDTYKVHMSIWDTSGDVGYDRVRPLAYSEADLVIICFAINKPDSLEDVVGKWYPEVREQCPNLPVMLVGCKSDSRADIKAAPPDKEKPLFVTYDQGLKTAKHIGALVYSETSSKMSQRSVDDVMEVAALSSAGSKSGCSFAANGESGNTSTASNSSCDSQANSSSSTGAAGDTPFRRQRSFMRRKQFNGVKEAKVQLRKEATKSCIVM